jgi:predicted Zn-dependent protease
LTEGECRSIGERALRFVEADEALVRVDESSERTTRFANNAISYNASVERLQVTVRVAFGDRVGSATLEATDGDALREAARRAEEAARGAPPDPEFLPVLGPQEYLPVEAFFPDTAEVTSEEQIRLVLAITESARRANFAAAGTVETGSFVTSLASSSGLLAYHARTDAEIGCTMTAPDGSGWARRSEQDIRHLDAAAIGAEAVDLARRSTAPRSLPAGKYTVLFQPAAVANLLPALVYQTNARQTEAGLTFLAGRVGDVLAGENITLRSNPVEPGHGSVPFDDDGMPQRPRVWFERGRHREQMRDRWTARQTGLEPVPPPRSARLDGTDRSLADLIGGIERGVLVTHLWYIRPVKIEQTLFTGMTRDGTFLIEDGRIAGPVRNLRFNDSALGMVQRAVDMGVPEPCGGSGYCWVFPPLVVRDWEFVSATDF